MKMRSAALRRAVEAACPRKTETEGQTPQQEQQLRNLGWTDTDIDHMSARQIEIILKKRTRRRKGAVQGATPEETAQMIREKLKGAKQLYDQLASFQYTEYNIGDFYKRQLPKSRALSDRIMKQKKQLESSLYSYQRQLRQDLKEVEKAKGASAAKVQAFLQAEGVTGRQAAHHQEGKDWYVDTEFINHSQRVYPGATLRHMGMGEFVLETPDGDIEFDRMRGKPFPGMSGRSHKLYGDDKAVKKLLKLMEQKGKSKKASVAAAPVTVSFPKDIRVALEKIGLKAIKTIPHNGGVVVSWRGKGKMASALKAIKALSFVKSAEPNQGRDDSVWVKVGSTNVQAQTKFSPYGSKKGTWWGRRASDSKTVRLKDSVAKEWIKKPAMKAKDAPRNADEYLMIWWVPPEYGKESKWRVDKNWIEHVWSWERGPNPKVKPGVDVVRDQG